MAVALDADLPNDVLLALRNIEGILDLKVINCEKH